MRQSYDETVFWHRDSFKISPKPNTDGMGNCLRQPGQLRHDEKTYASEFKATYQTFGTVTTPAAETKSIGLPANAQLSWFLHHHLDNYILT